MRLAGRAQGMAPTEQGFFQIPALEPGIYDLEVRGPDLSPYRLEGIEVPRGRELLLSEPLELAGLGRIEVMVTPPLDALGRSWQLRLDRSVPGSRFLESVATGPAGLDGSWVAEDLAYGAYSLRLLDEAGSGLHWQKLELAVPRQEIQVELPQVAVEGTVRSGEIPLTGTLVFSDGAGAGVRLESDGEGHFWGHLPHDGRWNVKLQIPGSLGQLFFEERVDVFPHEGAAYLEISLPATQIHGRVVDEDGRPVVPSLVNVYREEPVTAAQRKVDENGSFEIFGVEPGRLRLRAEAMEGRRSPYLEVDLEEDQALEKIELVIEAVQVRRWRVLSSGQPVAGARVHWSLPGLPEGGEQATGPSGRFSVGPAPGAEEIVLVVSAPGLPTRVLRQPLEESTRESDLLLAAQGGELVLDLQTVRYLNVGGYGVPLHRLMDWPMLGHPKGVDAERGLLTLHMEAGEYEVCPDLEPSRTCASGYLAPGGRLELSAQRSKDD